jgi:hypothetical protein
MHPGFPPDEHIWDMLMEGYLSLGIGVAWSSIKHSLRGCFLNSREKENGKRAKEKVWSMKSHLVYEAKHYCI